MDKDLLEGIIQDYERILGIVSNRLNQLRGFSKNSNFSSVKNISIKSDIEQEISQKRNEILSQVEQIKSSVQSQISQIQSDASMKRNMNASMTQNMGLGAIGVPMNFMEGEKDGSKDSK
jgi:DNA-binding ferritin-like protein